MCRQGTSHRRVPPPFILPSLFGTILAVPPSFGGIVSAHLPIPVRCSRPIDHHLEARRSVRRSACLRRGHQVMKPAADTRGWACDRSRREAAHWRSIARPCAMRSSVTRGSDRPLDRCSSPRAGRCGGQRVHPHIPLRSRQRSPVHRTAKDHAICSRDPVDRKSSRQAVCHRSCATARYTSTRNRFALRHVVSTCRDLRCAAQTLEHVLMFRRPEHAHAESRLRRGRAIARRFTARYQTYTC